MSVRAAELGGSQKAAVLLVHLGKEHASRVLASMTPDEVEDVTAEIVKLGSLPAELVDEVLGEFRTAMGSAAGASARGGIDVARELLESSFGRTRAGDLMEKLSTSSGRVPFGFLRDADPRQLHGFLSAEHPQTIALVLAHVRPEQASAILAGLSGELAGEVARRIGTMDRATPALMSTVADALFRRTSSVLAPVEARAVGGLQPLVEILNRADPGTEKVLLEGLDASDPELAEQVRSRLFVFDDILGLEDRAIQLVLRQVESASLAKALKGVRDEVREKVLGNVSERARENLLEEIELLGRVRLSEVEEARAAVVGVIRTLEASGEIVLRRGGDDDDDYVA